MESLEGIVALGAMSKVSPMKGIPGLGSLGPEPAPYSQTFLRPLNTIMPCLLPQAFSFLGRVVYCHSHCCSYCVMMFFRP